MDLISGVALAGNCPASGDLVMAAGLYCVINQTPD